MRKTILLFFAMLSMIVMTGCGPSLKDYVKKSNNYVNHVMTSTGATVNIEESGIVRGLGKLSTVGAVANAISGVATTALSSDQGQRLNRLIAPDKVAVSMSEGFNHNFAGMTHLQVVEDTAHPDLRIKLTVIDYGLYSKSLLSPMQFFVEAEVQVIYAPEMKTIYTNGATISRDASDIVSQMTNAVAGSFNVLQLASGAANLAALLKMSDEEIVAIFDYLSFDSGAAIAHQLVNEIYE